MKNLELYIQKYLMSLANKGYALGTQENYRVHLFSFAKWLRGKKINSDTISYYRLYLTSSKITKVTQNKYLITLRSFFSFMDREGHPIFSKEKIELAKVPERQINFLTSSQVKRMLNKVKMVKINKRLKFERAKERAILELLFSCGLRVSELCNLDRERVNIKRGEFTIIGKGGKGRLVFLSEEAKFWLKKYLRLRQDKHPALFVNSLRRRKKNNRLKSWIVQKVVDKYARKAYIPMKVTPHMLRHCLHKDSRIVLNRDLISAEELFLKKKTSVVSLNFQNNKFADGKITRYFSHKANSLLQIWASGREIICSPKHTFFTISQKGISPVEAKKLKVGMYIAGIKKINTVGKKYFPDNLWRLIGYIIGDATLSEARHGIIISEKRKDYIDFYEKLIKKTLNINPTITKSKNTRSYSLNIYNVKFLKQMRKLGITQKQPDRRVPQSLFKATNKEIASFLAGYYDAEGNSGTIQMFSSSKELLKDIQILFLRLGIDSFLYQRERIVKLPQGHKIKNSIFVLYICQKLSQTFFKKHIKTLKTGIFIKNISVYEKLPYDKLPIQPLINSLYKEFIPHNKGFVNFLGKKYGIL